MRQILSALTMLVVIAVPGRAADSMSGEDAFSQLKLLAGSWSGTALGEGEAAASSEIVHDFRVSAAGTVVMETMQPGGDHEMINMYHLDGDDLVLTHYCAGGNQPTMRLDRQASTPETLVFIFTGGTNLDPAADNHIHDARIRLVGPDRIVSSWTGYSGGVEVGVMTFELERDDG